MNHQPSQEFQFERDTGIIFEHAQPSDQPLKPRKTQFTNIPRLESVNAEAYNKQFEEMRKAMPKNLAYAGRFGTPDLTPSAVSSKPAPKQQTIQQPQPKSVTPPAAPAPTTVSSAVSVGDTTPKPAPEPPKPKKQPAVPPKTQDEPIEFYTGYQPEADPFTDDTYKTQEMLIKDHKKQDNTESFRSKFKRTFKKLFATEAEDEYYDDDE